MSLINDALKAAQQERRGRAVETTSVQPVGNLFPYPVREVKQRPTALFIGAIVAAVIVVGATAVFLKQRSDKAQTAAQHQPVSQVNRAFPSVPVNATGASTPIISGTVVNPPALAA